jgi:hypothetical protein
VYNGFKEESMYYVEKIINGELMYKGTPTSEWTPVISNRAEFIAKLASFDLETRHSILKFFCAECGNIKPCNCYKDE